MLLSLNENGLPSSVPTLPSAATAWSPVDSAVTRQCSLKNPLSLTSNRVLSISSVKPVILGSVPDMLTYLTFHGVFRSATLQPFWQLSTTGLTLPIIAPVLLAWERLLSVVFSATAHMTWANPSNVSAVDSRTISLLLLVSDLNAEAVPASATSSSSAAIALTANFLVVVKTSLLFESNKPNKAGPDVTSSPFLLHHPLVVDSSIRASGVVSHAALATNVPTPQPSHAHPGTQHRSRASTAYHTRLWCCNLLAKVSKDTEFRLPEVGHQPTGTLAMEQLRSVRI